MENWNDTEMKCSNAEVVKAFKLACENDGKRHKYMEMEDGTGICLMTEGGNVLTTVQEVSKQFPDDVIYCRHAFAADGRSELQEVEYCNGDSRLVNLKPNHAVRYSTALDDVDRPDIIERVRAFCNKIDMVRTDVDGKLFIDWFDGQVIFKFTHDGKTGKKYRIEATKKGSW